MRTYEAMVIVDSSLEEGDVQKAVDRFLGIVTDSGGTLGAVDRWGVRKFAYEIDHKNEGYYFVAGFSATQDTIEQLNQTLRVSDEFIRGKIIRPE